MLFFVGWVVFVVIGNVVFCGVGVCHHWKCSFLLCGCLLSLEMLFLVGWVFAIIGNVFFVGWVVFVIIGNVVCCGVGVCYHWKCSFLWGG